MLSLIDNWKAEILNEDLQNKPIKYHMNKLKHQFLIKKNTKHLIFYDYRINFYISKLNQKGNIILSTIMAMKNGIKEINAYRAYLKSKKEESFETEHLKHEYLQKRTEASYCLVLLKTEKRLWKIEYLSEFLSRIFKYFINKLSKGKKITPNNLKTYSRYHEKKFIWIFLLKYVLPMCITLGGIILPQNILGFLIIIELCLICTHLSNKFLQKIEIKIVFVCSSIILLLSLVGFIELLISKYFLLISIYSFFRILYLLLSILIIGLFNPQNFRKTITKIKKKFGRIEIKFLLNISFYFMAMVIFIRLIYIFLNPHDQIQNPYEILHNLVIFQFIPIDIIFLFGILITLLLYEIYQFKPNVSEIQVKLFILIVLISITGNVTTNWCGIDAVNLVNHLDPFFIEKENYFINFYAIFFFYSSSQYSFLTFFLSSINGTQIFITFLLPITNSIIYIILTQIIHISFKKWQINHENIDSKKRRFAFILLIIIFVTSPIQWKFTHIGNSETLGTISLILLLFSMISKNDDVEKYRVIFIILSCLLSLFHFSHAFIVVPVSIFYLIYQYSKTPITKPLLLDIKFYGQFFLLLTISWLSYISLEISNSLEHYFLQVLDKFIPRNYLREFTLFTVPQLNNQVVNIFSATFFAIPIIILLILFCTKKFGIFERLEYLLQCLFIILMEFLSRIQRFLISKINFAMRKNILPLTWIFGSVLILANQIYSHQSLSWYPFVSAILFMGQIIVLSQVLLSFLDLMKSKPNIFMPFIIFDIIFVVVSSTFILVQPLGPGSYMEYFYRFANWFLLGHFVLILSEQTSTKIWIQFWQSKPTWVLLLFSAFIIVINILATFWEYAY
ncbi:hypothetical protein [Candidatus Lokiarchaeum ossiferum]